MDALASISMHILNNKKTSASKKFNEVTSMIINHLKELKQMSSSLDGTHTSIRIECLMKMDLSPLDHNYIQFPDGFLDTNIGTCTSNYLSNYYHQTVTEACNCLLSFYPSLTNDELRYKSLQDMSANAKTACIYYSEMLALEFGSMNIKGSVMTILKKMLENHGSFHITQSSRLCFGLTETDV